MHAAVRRLPEIGRNPVAARNYARFGQLVSERPNATVLVIGGSIVGQGMESILSSGGIHFVETDVVIGPRTQLVCDAHDIPFSERSFDGVIIQAVLEHVADPYRVVAEIHRVLKEDGVVYAETPFMQQVHGGRYDFTRFTHLGHRRLFRKFDEIDSGIVGGPGMALAWSYEYFLLSFFNRRVLRGLARAFSRLTGFWLKYVDIALEGKSGAFDASSGHYFLGRRSESTLSDRELIKLYRGAQQAIRV
jgi:SAM-dependent methyltransferase